MVMANSVFLSFPINHSSGWIATVMFFSTNVGSGVVMLFSALLFTVDTVLMGLVLIKVSMTVTFYTSLMIQEFLDIFVCIHLQHF